MRFFSFFEYGISSALGRTLDLLCKVVDTTSPTLSIWQCPPRCQHVESRARWMLAVTSCCSAAQRKVFPHRPTPGRSWTRCPGCRTTPCKVLQTSWPSEFPFAPPLLVNLTHITELRLSNNPTISATCHVPGPNYCPPKGPPPPSPLILLRGDDGWMVVFQTMWTCEWVNDVCGINPDEFAYVVFFYVLPHSLMLNTNSCPLIPNTEPVRSAVAVLLLIQPSGELARTQLHSERLVFSIRKQCGLSFLFQLCSLHSQIIFITSYTLCLYTTGQYRKSIADSRTKIKLKTPPHT